MNLKKTRQFFIIMVCCLITAYHVFGQKYDYNYIDRSFSSGSAVSIQYSDTSEDIEIGIFPWEGTVSYSPILSDSSGIFLGYFNCRNIYDSIGRVAINGDSMAVGYFLNYLFQNLPEHEGLGNGGNSFFIPITDSLYYLFYKSAELWIGAPGFAINFIEKGIKLTSYSDGLYLTKVRRNADHRLYILPEEKHILLVDDLFQFADLIPCKHANGKDWWIIAPKALNSKASRLLIKSDGSIELLGDIEFSDNYWRVRSMTSCKMSPDGSMLARFFMRPNVLFDNLLELFHFDRCEGTVERFFLDSIPLTHRFTSYGDIEFSESGRYVYIANGEIILQLDLNDPDFFSNKDTIGIWDGYEYVDFFATLFDCFWRLPNGKILVASGVATPFLHYIHEPDLPGDACMFEQRAIELPPDPLNEPFGAFLTALPNFPPFRMEALSTSCSTSVSVNDKHHTIVLYPNPTDGHFNITHASGLDVMVYNLQGVLLHIYRISPEEDVFSIPMEDHAPGLYVFVFRDKSGAVVSVKKGVKV